MLKAPSIATVDGATIWADDASFYTYYVTSQAPRLRLDKNGDPVFLLVQYALSDQERRDNPQAPAGGGYMNLDATFAPTEVELEAAKALVQPIINAEWARLRAGTAEERALEGVKGTTNPPEVVFASPTYTQGNVIMFAPQSEALISAQVAEGKPDLMAGNIAVFNADLTPNGSDFMVQTLVADGAGSDLTPIQLRYDLSFWARLPPVEITVTANAERVYDETRKFMEGEGVDACTTYDFQNSDITTSLAEMSGLIDVHIDPGSASVDEEVLAELREYALSMMQNLIESSFFTADPEEAFIPGLPEDIIPENLDDPNAPTKKWLRKVEDTQTMDLTLNLTQEAVVEWTISPQATLQTFFEGRTAAEMNQFVRSIRLNNPFFQNLDFTARVFADFDNTELEAVELELDYRGREADGTSRQVSETMTFVDGTAQSWNQPLIGDARDIRYRWRSKLTGDDFTPWSAPAVTRSNALNLSIPSPGSVTRTIASGDLDFEGLGLQSVQIEVEVLSATGDILDSGVRALTQQLPTSEITLSTGHAIPDLVRYRKTYRLTTGEQIVDDDWSKTTGDTIIVNTPFGRALDVTFLPVGDGWEEISTVIVNARYDDGQGHTANEVLTLQAKIDVRRWKVWLAEGATQNFTYAVTVSYADGDFVVGDPVTVTGSGTVPIEVREPQSTRISLVAARLDFDHAAVTKVVLTHPASGETKTFTFTDRSNAEWVLPVRPSEPLNVTAQITHLLHDGDEVVLPPIEVTDTALVLPPHRMPQTGELHYTVMPTLVDFAATPLVTVDLRYDDEAHNVSHQHTMAFGDGGPPDHWVIPVADMNRRMLMMTVTYFVAPDNQAHSLGPFAHDQSLYVIPPFSADM